MVTVTPPRFDDPTVTGAQLASVSGIQGYVDHSMRFHVSKINMQFPEAMLLQSKNLRGDEIEERFKFSSPS